MSKLERFLNPRFGKAGSQALIAFSLGLAVGLGFYFSFSHGLFLGKFLILLGIFHIWEYLWVAMFQPQDLSVDSFLLNHSREFLMAIGFSFLENFLILILRYYGWRIPRFAFLSWIGFFGALLGQGIRTVSMFQCGRNFQHIVREVQEEGHELVTTGIYGMLRHPSYFGWFYWAVFSQVAMGNWIMLAANTWVSWQFFKKRIVNEEELLMKQYGEKYGKYRIRVPIGIPYIKT